MGRNLNFWMLFFLNFEDFVVVVFCIFRLEITRCFYDLHVGIANTSMFGLAFLLVGNVWGDRIETITSAANSGRAKLTQI